MLKYQIEGVPLPRWRVDAMLKIGQLLTAEKIPHEWFDFYFKATEQHVTRYVCECQILGRDQPIKVWADSIEKTIEVFERAIKEIKL